MSDDPLQKALARIEEIEVDLGPTLAELRELKAWVNTADKISGREPRFGDLDAAAGAAPSGVATLKWAPGTFYNKPFAGAVKQILLARAAANGRNPSPASIDEIHEALTQGSFAFETSGAENQKNSIRISLGKNSAQFSRLPNSDLFGLPEWYGKKSGATRRRASAASGGEAADDDASADD